LFPVVNTSQPNLFDSAMIRLPRMRACKFSSVMSRSRSSKTSASMRSKACIGSSIRRSISSVRRVRAIVRASSWVSLEEYGDGMTTHVTRSGPSASTAISATSAESIPPERPNTTRSKPFFST
jgi:hypothetical protein